MSLITNALAYWKLDEASGNPQDATVNAKTLTNTNLVGFAPGVIGNGADFGVANTNKTLFRSGLIGTDGIASFSMGVKMRTEISSGTQTLMQWATESTSLELLYDYNGGTRRLWLRRGRNGIGYVDIYHTITLGTAAFYRIVGVYDGANLTLYVNNVQVATIAASGNGSGPWAPGGGGFMLGAGFDSNTPTAVGTQHASVYIDEVGLWSKAPTTDERTLVSSDIQYPFFGTTTAVSGISSVAANSGGTIVYDGAATITQRGVCWSTTPTPTIANSTATSPGTIGAFSVTMPGLTFNTTYYVRGYYTNALGTFYGNEVSFTTLNPGQYEAILSIDATEGQTFAVSLTVGGTVGTVTAQLGSTGTSQVIVAGSGVSTFEGTYGGEQGLILTRSADFNGTVDDVYYVVAPLGTTVNWSLDTLTLVTAIESEVFFKRIENEVFNSFRFYRYLELLFKDVDGYVSVTIRSEREDNTTDSTKEFVVGNQGTGQVSPFQKKRISFLSKNQAIIIGLSNANLNETFSIAQFLLTGHERPKRMFSPSKIISL